MFIIGIKNGISIENKLFFLQTIINAFRSLAKWRISSHFSSNFFKKKSDQTTQSFDTYIFATAGYKKRMLKRSIHVV